MAQAARRVQEAPINTRPASLRPTGSPFTKQKRKAGSKKLGLDMEKIDFSYSHKARMEENLDAQRLLRRQLQQAEAEGKYSKAKKLRRQINYYQEEGLYLTHSFCGGCLNVLHNCHCG